MKNGIVLPALIAILALTPSPAAAQDVSGTWHVELHGARGTQSITMELVQQEGTLSGTLTIPPGGRGGGGVQTLDVENGTVHGGSFSLSYTQSFRGNTVAVSMSGKVEGDSMEGTIEGGRGGARPFTGRRER